MATVITRSAHPDALWPGVLEMVRPELRAVSRPVAAVLRPHRRRTGHRASDRGDRLRPGAHQDGRRADHLRHRRRGLRDAGDAGRDRAGLPGDARGTGGRALHGGQPAARREPGVQRAHHHRTDPRQHVPERLLLVVQVRRWPADVLGLAPDQERQPVEPQRLSPAVAADFSEASLEDMIKRST